MRQRRQTPTPGHDPTVPQRPDDPPVGSASRSIALVALNVALGAQVCYLLAGFFAFGLGGGSGLEMALFFIGGVLVLAWLVWLRRAVSRQRMRAATAFLVFGAAAADLAVVALLANGVLAGSCSERELRVIRETPSYERNELSFSYDPGSGACAGSLAVDASAADVLSHYQRELEADGWTVSIEDIPSEGPPGEEVVARDLTARRGDSSFTIALESWSGQTSAAIRVDA